MGYSQNTQWEFFVVEKYPLTSLGVIYLAHVLSNPTFYRRLEEVKHLLAINGLTEECLVLKDITDGLNGHLINPNDVTKGRHPWSDLLNSVYFDESLLRTAIDIILENNNSSSADFEVLEINPNNGLCYEQVIKYLNDSFFNLKIKYSAYAPGHAADEDQGDNLFWLSSTSSDSLFYVS